MWLSHKRDVVINGANSK